MGGKGGGGGGGGGGSQVNIARLDRRVSGKLGELWPRRTATERFGIKGGGEAGGSKKGIGGSPPIYSTQNHVE